MRLLPAQPDPTPEPIRETTVVSASEELTEAHGTFMIDPIDGDFGFRSIGGVAADMSHAFLRKAQDWSAYMYRSNPLANRIIRIYSSFLAGEGFAVGANNPEVDEVVNEFWTADRNKLDQNNRGYARDAMLFGEGIHPVSADEAGNATFGYIDPRVVASIERSPLNNMILDAVNIRRAGGFNTDRLEAVKTVTSLDRADFGLLDGEVFIWPYERVGAATRGLPLLLPVLDWIDLFDQNLWEMMERTKAMRAFYWDVEVDGDGESVKKAKELFGRTPPKSGSMRFHTSTMRINAISPQLGGYEDVNSARFLLRHIAAGSGLAPHWLSEPEDANRSTAEQMDIPVLRSLTDVQAWWINNVREQLRYVVDRKVAAGMLDAVVPEHMETGQPRTDAEGNQILTPARDLITVMAPEIQSAQVQEQAAALGAVANALIALQSGDLIPDEVARKVIRTMLPALGVDPAEMPEPAEDGDEAGARAEVDALANQLEEALGRMAL